MSLPLAGVAAQVASGGAVRPAATVAGIVGEERMQFTALSSADDGTATMDGLTKGFQRIKLPTPMASAIPGAVRQWQRSATLDTDASGIAGMGAKAQELQAVIGKAVVASTRSPVLANEPSQVLASWDRAGKLRVHLSPIGSFALLRQSSLFSGGKATAGSEPADTAHVDMTPLGIEMRVQREAAERLGCSRQEALVLSVSGTIRHGVRELGVSADDVGDDEVKRLMDKGTLREERVWMSPNSAAKPLAFLDCATVDYEQYMNGDALITGFEPGPSFLPDFTKKHSLASWPEGMKMGQIQLVFRPDPAHRWYYFHDLSEDEAVIFDGLQHTFHTAFTPVEQVATEERASAEMTWLCLVVSTEDEREMQDCATFLSALRGEDRQFVFRSTSGERCPGAARTFLDKVMAATRR
mmetsp:Transcript_127993/g.398556  ORF Transcript_127993/g.398556 Transcript_127993/m.398556 type:complete len:411 (+) Transcript_127993:55-1287(+)